MKQMAMKKLKAHERGFQLDNGKHAKVAVIKGDEVSPKDHEVMKETYLPVKFEVHETDADGELVFGADGRPTVLSWVRSIGVNALAAGDIRLEDEIADATAMGLDRMHKFMVAREAWNSLPSGEE